MISSPIHSMLPNPSIPPPLELSDQSGDARAENMAMRERLTVADLALSELKNECTVLNQKLNEATIKYENLLTEYKELEREMEVSQTRRSSKFHDPPEPPKSSSSWSSVAESESSASTGNPWSPSSSNFPSPRRGRRSRRSNFNSSGDIDSIDEAKYEETTGDEREYWVPENFYELNTRHVTLREDFTSLQVHYSEKTDLLKKVKRRYAHLKKEHRALSAKMTVYEEEREDYENLQSNHEVLRREHTELNQKYNTPRNPITSVDEISTTLTISLNYLEDTKELRIKLTQYQRSHKDLSNHNSLLTEELSNMRFIIRSHKPTHIEQEPPLRQPQSPSSLLAQNRYLHTTLTASQNSCATLRHALDYLEDQYTDFQLQYNALYEKSAPATQTFARAMWKPWNRVGETTLPKIWPKPLAQGQVPSASSVVPPASSVVPGWGDVLMAVMMLLSLVEWVG